MSLWGTQTWIMWPPTDTNLEGYGRFHKKSRGRIIKYAIENLETPTVVDLSEGEAIYMPPGTIHAIISPNPSSTCACFLARLEDFPQVKINIGWELNVLPNRPVSTQVDSRQDLLDDLQTLTCIRNRINEDHQEDFDHFMETTYQQVNELPSEHPPYIHRRAYQ